jgi:hypothetical protein
VKAEESAKKGVERLMSLEEIRDASDVNGVAKPGNDSFF